MQIRTKDFTERRIAVEAEMASLYDAAEKAGEDLTGEKLERWNALKVEKTELTAKEERARTRDAIDRQAPARDVSDTGQNWAWALTREQRMADYVKATSGQSAEGLSVGRAVRAALTGNWKDAEPEKRAMGSGVNTTGGFFVPDPISANVIDLARNVSVLVNAGAVTIPMIGNNMTLVRVVTDPTAAWRSEGMTISESDAGFDAILVAPTSIAALCRVNAELMDDAPNFASQLDSQLAAAIALKLDASGLYGSGVGAEPFGLRSTSDVHEISMGTNGLALSDYDNLLNLIRDVELGNGTPTTLVWSARTKNSAAKLVTGMHCSK